MFHADGGGFDVPWSAYNALIEDVTYRVWRLARSKEFLSLEPADLVHNPPPIA